MVFLYTLYVGVLVALLASYPTRDKHFYLLASAWFVLLVGFVDDLKDLGVWVRILIQILVCFIMIKGAGIYVESLGDLFGFGEIYIGAWGIPFTIFAVIGLVNAINMSDGIDGLTGSLVLVDIIGIFDFLLIMAVTLIPYLLTNLTIVSGRKIFLGDAGSMFIGFILAWELIELSQTPSKAIEPVGVIWCVALPVIDTLVVIIKRLKAGHSPFSPDRAHFHHMLQDMGLSSRQTLVTITAVALTLTRIGWLVQYVAPQAGLILFGVI